LPGVSRIIGLDDPAPECTAGCPLLSLPLALGVRDPRPAERAYARVPPGRAERWRAWLDGIPGRRIGLVCSGAAHHPHDGERSIPLTDLAPVLRAPDCSFVLLQPDVRERDGGALARFPNLHWPGDALADFADTAALLEQLDLLIAVDSAVAHLAGALARPVWLMLRYAPDFRWLLNRSDSPWYPAMRLFRQQRPREWGAVVAAVRQALDDAR
jgi:hypothetical protein